MCTTTVPATAAEALAMLESAQGMQQCALGFLAAPGRGEPARPGGRGPAAGPGTGRRGRGRPAGPAAGGLRHPGRAPGRRAAHHPDLAGPLTAGHQGPGRRVPGGPGAGPQPPRAACGAGRGLGAHHVRGPAAGQVDPGHPGGVPGRGRGHPGRGRPGRRGPARAAAICAGIRARTAEPDPDPDSDPRLDRGVSLDTTFEGAGVIRGDLTPGCAAMVQAVLDALSAPAGGGDLRTRPQRYHDALAEAMRRLLASDLLPRRAGQPVKALVHIYFAELRERDQDAILQDKWIAEYRARWAAHRAAASVSTGDGGAWLDGDAAREVAVDAMIIPVVTGDIDPGAVEDLIALCVLLPPAPHPARTRRPRRPWPRGCPRPHRRPGSRRHRGPHGLSGRPGRQRRRPRRADQQYRPPRRARRRSRRRPGGDGTADPGQDPAGRLGPRRRRLLLRRHLLGKPLAGPSLPLDVGQTDDIPLHLRRLVALRDQHCQ